MNRESGKAFPFERSSAERIHEERFLETSSDPLGSVVEAGGSAWILHPLFCGILNLTSLQELIAVLSEHDVQKVRLSPEQNLLIPCAGPGEAETLLESLNSPEPDSKGIKEPSRIATCPGARFCSNVELEPVSLARRIQSMLHEDPTRAQTAGRLPMAITGCGETEHLEKLYPIGITPHPAGSGYALYVGGEPHNGGQAGLALETSFPGEAVPETIAEWIDDFGGTPAESFRSWALERFGSSDRSPG